MTARRGAGDDGVRRRRGRRGPVAAAVAALVASSCQSGTTASDTLDDLVATRAAVLEAAERDVPAVADAVGGTVRHAYGEASFDEAVLGGPFDVSYAASGWIDADPVATDELERLVAQLGYTVSEPTATPSRVSALTVVGSASGVSEDGALVLTVRSIDRVETDSPTTGDPVSVPPRVEVTVAATQVPRISREDMDSYLDEYGDADRDLGWAPPPSAAPSGG
ncbi:hypothetical protein FH969_06860 [Miniimonas arenae]|uniref:Uncharacterized protein n=2 Tax=Miniimonas arenae TaxID=676201 RepID=A0A5C5BC36_9MICO|nr:hypothetical protein [Miniimonas arenae]TNU74919.1 hypothetical protein FH969_06860 [Miniimonas arenae]